MKKTICLIALLLAGVFCAAAQNDDEVTIRLRNGIEVRGVVVESSSESVTLRTADGDVFVYRMNEISRMDGAGADMVVENKTKRVASKDYGNFKGYRGIIEFTPYINTNYGEFGMHLTMINGYNFGPWIYAGIGVGLNIDFNDQTLFSLPVFAHVRSAFLKNRRVSPYISLNIGYNIGLTLYEDYYKYTGTNSGFYAEPAVGVEFRFSRKSALTLGVSAPLVPVSFGEGELAIYGVGLKVGCSF